MGNTITKGTNFPHTVANEIFNKVQGHSALAKLSAQRPLSFAGTDVFTFAMDSDIAIVAENGAKANGGATATPVAIVPIKVEYGTRVSDEFLYASEERALEILEAFAEGFARKLARGLDIMAMHGLNPRGLTASSIIGTNSFDTNTGVSKVEANGVEAGIADAIEAMGDYIPTGIALSKASAGALSQITSDGARPYQAYAWGGNPETMNGLKSDVNSTVSAHKTGAEADLAIIGDFENAFRWGVAKDIPMEVIEYGDPDNTGSDLKGHNQVYLRGEAYIGWGILDPGAFAVIVPGID